MKPTGIVRKIDRLGRIVIPKEICKTLDIKENTPLEIFTEDNIIMLRKYQPSCIFCQNARDVTTYKGYNICPSCLKELSEKNNV